MNLFAGRKKKQKTLMIVCTANMTRSPYFAALMQKKIEDKKGRMPSGVTIESAGTQATDGGPAHLVITNVAGSRGLDLSRHRSARFSSAHASRADLILTMEQQHKNKILKEYPQLEGKVFTILEYGRAHDEIEERDIDDPTGLEVEDYLAFRDMAEQEADRVLHRLMVSGFLPA
ncbi:hypothetical protein GF324_13850 [bacterium]|nr:hypothetical protein [bacterium]